MHPIQEKLVNLSKTQDLGKLSLKDMAKMIGSHEPTQTIKHHLLQLHVSGQLGNVKLGQINRFSSPTSLLTKPPQVPKPEDNDPASQRLV